MLYEVLCRIIGILCLHTGTPLSAERIAQLLDGLFDEELIVAVCMRMQSEGKLFHVGEGTYTLRSMFRKVTCTEILISKEYQHLGMTLMEVDNDGWTRRILPEAEHRFLEIKPSTIGGDSGMGLFVRRNRRIPLGCVICEYSGRRLVELPPHVEQGIYVVHVRNAGTYIDGVTAEGEHLSLATFINDNGPAKANAGMMEYARHPGRVFVVANRDLQPGEEVFVLYGATYWGFTSYAELAQQARRQRELREQALADRVADISAAPVTKAEPARKRPRAEKGRTRRTSSDTKTHNGTESASGTLDAKDKQRDTVRVGIAWTCRRCGDLTIDRAARLHNAHCGDPLVHRKLMRMDCTPFDEFTALDVPRGILSSSRSKASRRASMLVKLSDPQTFSHTHMDVVRDLEFTFEEADGDSPPSE